MTEIAQQELANLSEDIQECNVIYLPQVGGMGLLKVGGMGCVCQPLWVGGAGLHQVGGVGLELLASGDFNGMIREFVLYTGIL